MKIDGMSGYPVFKRSGGPGGAKAAPAPERAAKTDVADFSRVLGAALDKSMAGVKASVMMDAAKPTGAQELAALKESVQNGSYHRTADKIADAILDNIV